MTAPTDYSLAMSDQTNPLPPPSFDPPQPLQPSEPVEMPVIREYSPSTFGEPTTVMPVGAEAVLPPDEPMPDVVAEPMEIDTAPIKPLAAIEPAAMATAGMAPAPKRRSVVPWIIAVVGLAAAGTFAFLWVGKSGDVDDAQKAATAAAAASTNTATDAAAQSARQIADLQTQLTGVQTQLTDVQNKLTDAETRAADGEAKAADLQGQLDAVAGNDQKSSDVLAAAQVQIADLTSANVDLQAQLDAANATISAVPAEKKAVDFAPAASLGVGRLLLPGATAVTDDQAACVGGLYFDLAGFDSIFGGLFTGAGLGTVDKAILEQVATQAPDLCGIDAALFV